jgi:phosphoribosylanthranilate isomerase
MQRVRVKICGVRDPVQALRIAQMGADAIGLVFASSPRWVSPEQARAVADALPAFVQAVGVFVNDDADTINRVVQRVGLDLAQLHGDESPELLEQIRVPCIKAFAVSDRSWIDRVRAWLECVCDRRRLKAILLDAYNPAGRGGTGQRFNWDWVAQARAEGQLRGLPPLILSGGLDDSVVSDAIELVQPWAVDVSSGVESSPGVKDIKKIERFIGATREGSELRSEFWM